MRPFILAVFAVTLTSCTELTDPTGVTGSTGRSPSYDLSTPVPVTITYTGPLSAEIGSVPIWNVLATVTATGEPAAGVLIACSLDDNDGTILTVATPRTGPDGRADCVPYPIGAPFYPRGYYLIISASSPPYTGAAPIVRFDVLRGTTTLTWTGTTTTFEAGSQTITLSARLRSLAGGMPGSYVRLGVDGSDGYPAGDCLVQTDASSEASCVVDAYFGNPGPITLWARYEGDISYLSSGVRVPGLATPPPPPPPPPLPTTAADCRNDGWRQYGVFKNQGDCVSFVATKARNAPAIE